MVRLITISVFLIILAIFIVFNAGYSTGFSMFGWNFESVPTVTVIILSFVTGVLFSMGIYFGNYFRQHIRSRFKQKQKNLKEKESQIKQQNKEDAAIKKKRKKNNKQTQQPTPLTEEESNSGDE